MKINYIADISITLQITFQILMSCFLYFYSRKNENYVLMTFAIATVCLTIFTGIVFLIVRFGRYKRAKLDERIHQLRFTEQLNQKYAKQEQTFKNESERLQYRLECELSEATKFIDALERGQDDCQMQHFLEATGDVWSWRYCANAIANVILSERAEVCIDKHIVYQVDAKIPAGISLSDYHICILLSNLLDNAVEACSSLEKEQRIIKVNAHSQKRYLYLSVENSCTLKYAKRPKRLGHGFGIEIVRDVVEQYQGQMRVDQQANWHRVEIIIPHDFQ